MIKTKWKIEQNRVTIYPFGFMKVLGIVFGLLFLTTFGFMLFLPGSISLGFTVPYVVFFGALVVLVFATSRNSLVFDNNDRKLYRKLFDKFTVATYHFDEIAGVNILNTNLGAFSYRVYLNSNKHGRGIPASSGYSKRTDPNAVAFANDVLPILDSYLKAADLHTNVYKEPITNYEFFIQKDGTFAVKKSRIVLAIIGVVLVYLGYYLVRGTFLNDGDFRGYLAVIAAFAFGFGLIFAAFSTMVFDPQAGVIRNEWPFKMRIIEYPFRNFTGFNIVRRTTNAMYSGTDVRMNFQLADGKVKVLALRSFRSTKKIERLLEETRSIMQSSNQSINNLYQ